MLVKVKEGFGRFYLVDNVINVNYDSAPRTAQTAATLASLNDDKRKFVFLIHENHMKSISADAPLHYAIIDFLQIQNHGSDKINVIEQPYRIVFSTSFFLCNDTGRTIDKVVIDGSI